MQNKNCLKCLPLMLVLIPVLVATGCSSIFDPNLGKTTHDNIAIQTVNPDADQQEAPLAALDGQKAEQTLNRYRKQKVDAGQGSLLKGIKD